MSYSHGVIHVLENLFHDWRIWVYKEHDDNKSWCMQFHLKLRPGTTPVWPGYIETLEEWALLAKLYVRLPVETNSCIFYFTIYFDMERQYPTAEFSITGLKYANGKRMAWNHVTGNEIDAFITETMERHLPRMYKPPHIERPVDVYATNYGNIPEIAVSLFNQHLERILGQRNQKYNVCFYHKVRLCLPAEMPKEMVWEVAKYGFLNHVRLDFVM